MTVFFLITFLLPLRLPPDAVIGGAGDGSLAGGAGRSATGGGGEASLEGAFDISSSESSSIIFRNVSLRSDLDGPLGLGFAIVLVVVEGMKSSSCSDSEASFMGSVGRLSVLDSDRWEWIGETNPPLSYLL